MFTPGPWRVGEQFKVTTQGGATIAFPQADAVGSPAEFRANAKLIAAAPELLAALQSILDIEPDDYGERIVYAGNLIKAREAINKATR